MGLLSRKRKRAERDVVDQENLCAKRPNQIDRSPTKTNENKEKDNETIELRKEVVQLRQRDANVPDGPDIPDTPDTPDLLGMFSDPLIFFYIIWSP